VIQFIRSLMRMKGRFKDVIQVDSDDVAGNLRDYKECYDAAAEERRLCRPGKRFRLWRHEMHVI
jgi:hypothetical protein